MDRKGRSLLIPAPQSPTRKLSTLLASGAGVLIITIGLLGLVGWYTHTLALIQVFPTFAPMQYNTALAFVLCGGGLTALVHGRPQVAMSLASAVATIGLLTLIQYVFGVHLGIDEIFFEHYETVQISDLGRMAPNTALCFSLASLALIMAAPCKKPGHRVWVLGVFGVFVFSLSTLALFGYVTGVPSAYGWGQFPKMALHTSVGMVMLALGILTLAFRDSLAWSGAASEFALGQPEHDRRRIVVTSGGIMAVVSMAVGLTVIIELYNAGLTTQRDRLTELVQSRAQMIESAARFEEPEGADALPTTLSQVLDDLEHSPGFGQTGEFTLARREGAEIVFIVTPPHGGPDFVERVDVGSPRAEPMQLALQGGVGTLVGLDYRSQRVIAAYLPLDSLGLGLVAKMDLAEVRAPFLRSALLTLAVAIGIIAIGACAIMVSIAPLARRVETQANELYATNTELTLEAAAREESVKALRESEENLRTVFEAAETVAFVTTDLGGEDARVVGFSPGAENLFGYTAEEIVGQKVALLHTPELVRDFPAMQKALREGSRGYPQEITLIPKSGERFPAIFTLHPHRNGAGALIGTVGVSVDITQRKYAEEQRNLLATAVEQAAEAIVIIDDSGNIEYVNPAFAAVTGYTRAEAVGMRSSALRSGDQPQAFYDDMWKTLQDGHVWTGHLINKGKDGTVFEEEATISPVFNADGDIVNYVAVKRDVTRETELEARLVQTQKMEAIGTLAGGIAHDFNNLLQIMLGYVDLAQTDIPPNSPALASLDEVVTAGRRATDLVGQILAFSRQSEQERRPVRLQSIFGEVLKLMRASIPTTIEIQHFIDPDCGVVLADATEVHQVAMNLCTNAYHAMRDDGGVLEIRLEEVYVDSESAARITGMNEGMTARLSVSDTGVGMDAPTVARIFDPYFTTKKIGEGTGLGLATVRGIVESCGGAVTVESKPDEGTLFEVYFPLAPSGTQGVGETAVEAGELYLGGERLLLVDDEPMLVDQARMGLERLGYQVESRTSSIEALEVMRANPDRFDVIITDQTMPQMTGMELTRKLLQIRPELPVILCTGFSETVDEASAKASGIQKYVNKPVLPRDLAMAIREIIDD